MSIRENVVAVLTIIVSMWGSVFTYNTFIGDQKSYELKSEITSHIDESVGKLRDDINKLPTSTDVENSQLKSMLYAKDLIDDKRADEIKRLNQLEAQLDQLSRKVEVQQRPGEVESYKDARQPRASQ